MVGPDDWAGLSGVEELIDQQSRSLERVERGDDDERDLAQISRSLYLFARRLASKGGGSRTHEFLLRTLAHEIGARTGSFAAYVESERALAITATLGYPLSLVEHLRIPVGSGILGETFAKARPIIAQPRKDMPRRLRYRTDSYLVVPLGPVRRAVGVIALTDRVDNQPFDTRDLAAARMLAAVGSLALAGARVADTLEELTKAATVDAVTGLLNRRYFETRVQAEVQRARRQQLDLALLMVDIDDFKRINDTFGHLEGDRTLRDVADLLRSGVRIFDVCARYGGDEFVIVMPGAGQQIAIQVAERIRRGIHDGSRLDGPPITVSVGVGFLEPGESAEELIGSADRALMAAKRAGKNVVRAHRGWGSSAP